MSASNRTIINSIGLFIHQFEREGQPIQQTIAGLNPGSSRSPADAGTPRSSSQTPTRRQNSRSPHHSDPGVIPFRYVHPAFHGGLYDATFNAAERRGNYADPPDPNKPFDVRIVLTEIPQSALPIRQIRRNSGEPTPNEPTGTTAPDSDGGYCPRNGGQAYFYSAGPDGDPSSRSDNVYVESSRPTFPR